jgi:hypothetical protein
MDDRTLLVSAVVAILFVAWLWWDRRGASRGAETQLRKICFGDERQVERMIEGEMRRSTGTMSRGEAARRAVERHRRDNR